MKKKCFFRLFPALLFLALISSCKHDYGIQIEREQFQKSYFLSSDTTSGQLKVDLDVEFLVALADTTVLKRIQSQIIEKYILKTTSSPNTNLGILEEYALRLSKEFIDNNLNDFVQQKESDDFNSLFLYNHEFSLRAQFLPEVKDFISYGVEYYSYDGGAHGINYKVFSNYCLKSGNLITEKDLFLENSEKELSTLLRNQLIKEDEELANEEDLEERFWGDKIEPNGNFYITENSINYVYNPYEIAPYSMGIIEIELPFSLLREVIKKNGPIKALI